MTFRPKLVGGIEGSYQWIKVRRLYLWRLYSAMREDVIRNVSEDVFCIEGIERKCKSFVGFLQVFSGKTGAMVESTALVAPPIHVVLLNSSAVYQWWLVQEGLDLVGFF